MVSVHRPTHLKITLTSENVIQGAIKCQGGSFLQAWLKSSLLIAKKKLPYYNTATYTVNYATMCPGTVMIRPCSIKSSLLSLYPLRHSRDKLFQALYHFHSAS